MIFSSLYEKTHPVLYFQNFVTLPQEPLVYPLGDFKYLHQLAASIDRIFSNLRSKLPKLPFYSDFGVFFVIILWAVFIKFAILCSLFEKTHLIFKFQFFFTIPQEPIVHPLGDFKHLYHLTDSIEHIFSNLRSKLPFFTPTYLL